VTALIHVKANDRFSPPTPDLGAAVIQFCRVEKYALFALATKIGDPRSVGLRFGARGESFAAQFLDKRCREKRRNDRETFAGLESIHTLADFGKWFDAIAQHAADIEALKGGLGHG
jgi:hypothetical protein